MSTARIYYAENDYSLVPVISVNMTVFLVANLDKGQDWTAGPIVVTSKAGSEPAIGLPKLGSSVEYYILYTILEHAGKVMVCRVSDSSKFGGIKIGASFNNAIGVGDGVKTVVSGKFDTERCHPGTVTVWMDKVKIGYDNAKGVIMGTNLNDFEVNTVNYETGEVVLTFKNPIPKHAVIYIRWGFQNETFKDGLIDPDTYEFEDSSISQALKDPKTVTKNVIGDVVNGVAEIVPKSFQLYDDVLVPFPLVPTESASPESSTVLIMDGETVIAYSDELGNLVDVGGYLDNSTTTQTKIVMESVTRPKTTTVSTPRMEEVQVPRTETSEIPVMEDVQVPVMEDVQVPVMEDVQVPVMEDVQVPVMETVMEQETDGNGDPVFDGNGDPVMVPVMIPELDGNGDPVLDGNGDPVMVEKKEQKIDGNGDPVFETIQQQKVDGNGDPVFETVSQQKVDGNGDPIFETVSQQKTDGNGDPVFETVQQQKVDSNGDPVFETKQVPVLDGNGDPIIDTVIRQAKDINGVLIFDVTETPVLDENGDPVMETVQIPKSVVESVPAFNNISNFTNGRVNFALAEGYVPTNKLMAVYTSTMKFFQAIFANSAGEWIKEYGVIISDVDATEHSWGLTCYELREHYTPRAVIYANVSNREQVDGYGYQMQQEQRFNGKNHYIRVKHNPYYSTAQKDIDPQWMLDALPTISLPHNSVQVSYEPTRFGGGSNGYAPSLATYIQALKSVGSKEKYKIHLIVDTIADPQYQAEIIKICDPQYGGRGDCVGLLQVPFDCEASNNHILDTQNYRDYSLNLRTSYAMLWFGHMYYYDDINGRELIIPGIGYAAATICYTSQVAQVWFAAAGWQRGTISAQKMYKVVDADERDLLYDHGVNCYKYDPNRGIAAWGNRTLYGRTSYLESANVRWVLILCRLLTEEIAEIYCHFNFNNNYNRPIVRGLINKGFLEIQNGQGIYEFEVKLDGENNPDSVVAQKKWIIDYFVVPEVAGEPVYINANIGSHGMTFQDVTASYNTN